MEKYIIVKALEKLDIEILEEIGNCRLKKACGCGWATYRISEKLLELKRRRCDLYMRLMEDI